MSVLFIALVLAQAPAPSGDVPVAIVSSSRRDPGTSAALCEQLKTALGGTAMGEKESIDRLAKLGGVDPHACDGARLCLQKLAQLLHGVVIGVDVSKAGKLLAGHVEVVSFDRVESLATEDVTADAKSWPQKSQAAVASLAQRLSPQLLAMRPRVEPKPDLKGTPAFEPPREVNLTPEPPPTPLPSPEPAVTASGEVSKGPVPYVTAGSGIVSLGIGITLTVLGFLDRGTYQASFQQVPNQMAVASTLTDDKLTALATASNAKVGFGVGLIGLAVALGITAAILFVKD
jgi:hypothetical protein